MRTLATAILLAALGGCAFRAAPPDWVSGAAAQYPSSEYLVGRGQAASAEEARDRARADLAKIFEAQVSAQSQDEQLFHSAKGYEARSVRRVAVRAERIVEGIEIARMWQAPADASHHALAVLPRLKAANVLRADIARLDEATARHAERARHEADLFLRIGATGQALAAQLERRELQKALRVLDAAGIGEPPAWSVEALRAQSEALLRHVKLAPRVVRDTSGSLGPILEGTTAAAGFLAEAGESAEYLLEASLALEPTGSLEGWYWQRGVLEIRLLEAASARSRGVRRWPIKAAALAPQLAEQRALSEVEAALRNGLRRTLIAFSEGNQ